MATLSGETRELIDRLNFAHFGTLSKDGSPHVSPVWVDHDGTHILINTAAGRAKARNLERDRRVSLSIADQENPYRYMVVRGEVVEVTPEGAWEHFSRLAQKYTNRPATRRPGETRLIVKILPARIVHGDDSPKPQQSS